MKILSIFGTRPEAIKMAPVVQLLKKSDIESLTCVTGQHQHLLSQALHLFDIHPDIDLHLMKENQSLNALSTALLTSLTPVLEQIKPDRILVHGDTTTATMAALCAFQQRIPVAHIEAGLRTYQISQPYPEEFNRRMIDLASDLLFTPTRHTAQQLQQEHLSGQIIVTGNTIIDSLQFILKKLDHDTTIKQNVMNAFTHLPLQQKTILVTAHRRENHGSHLVELCHSLTQIAQLSVNIIFVMHPNPNVTEVINQQLKNITNIHLLPAQDYLHFIALMQLADMVVTDSGGIQEEACALNKPLFVWRNSTERQEASHLPNVHLIQCQRAELIRAIQQQLTEKTPETTTLNITYGDGHAAQRIVSTLLNQPTTPFTSSITT